MQILRFSNGLGHCLNPSLFHKKFLWGKKKSIILQNIAIIAINNDFKEDRDSISTSTMKGTF